MSARAAAFSIEVCEPAPIQAGAAEQFCPILRLAPGCKLLPALAGDLMRELVRDTLDFSLSVSAAVLGIVLDTIIRPEGTGRLNNTPVFGAQLGINF